MQQTKFEFEVRIVKLDDHSSLPSGTYRIKLGGDSDGQEKVECYRSFDSFSFPKDPFELESLFLVS